MSEERADGRPGEEVRSRLNVDPGDCSTCAHLRLQSSERSVFVRCGLAESDRCFRRYPPLPVIGCPGYELAAGGDSSL